MPRTATMRPLVCSDDDVRAFILDEMWRIGPYAQPEFTLSAQQLFDEARRRFGDYRCLDLEFWQH